MYLSQFLANILIFTAKRCILKSQVKLDTFQGILLVSFLARAKELAKTQLILIEAKVIKIFKSDFDRFVNKDYFLIIDYWKSIIIDNLNSILFKKRPQKTLVKFDLSTLIQLQRKFFPKSLHHQFIPEALLMYFGKQQVKQLFDKLIENFSDSLFAFDSISALMLKSQQHDDSIKYTAYFDQNISDTRKIPNRNFGFFDTLFVL